jgi:hypothetical protein
MNPTYQLRAPRPRSGNRLRAILTLGLAALLASALLCGTAIYTNVVPPFDLSIPLSHGQILEIGEFPDCPLAMLEMACLYIERRFPRAFRVIYWSAGTKHTLVSIPLLSR